MQPHAWLGRNTATLILLGIGAAPLPAQRITVGENVLVGRGIDRPLVEPHVAVHPTNPAHLLAAATVADATKAFSDQQYCSTFVSLDGGKTWGSRHDFDVPTCGDPWVGITPSGAAVFIALGKHRSITDHDGHGLVVFHSPDGGRTWSDTPSNLGWPDDHPTVAIDAGGGPRRGTLYVVANRHGPDADGKDRWGVSVWPSTDGGKTFGAPTFVSHQGNLINNAEIPVVLANGTLVVTYVDHTRYVADSSRFKRLSSANMWIMRSTDGARTFATPMLLSQECGGGWSWFGADTTGGPFRDRLYHVCGRKNTNEIALHYSADGGYRWTDLARVHSPNADTSVARRTPNLAVNNRGVVGVAWVDGRSDPRGKCHEIYFTASLDGGATFLPEQKVSSARSCPDSAANGAALSRWPTGRDYFGMTAGSDGRFHVLWSDGRNGRFQLWAAAVEVVR